MFSVKVRAISKRNLVRYLVFDTPSKAMSCMQCLKGSQAGFCDPERFFITGKLVVNPEGYLMNHRAIQTDVGLYWMLLVEKDGSDYRFTI